MASIQPTSQEKYTAEDWDDVFTQNSDQKYLNEYHVPNWVMKSAMRYHFALQGNDSKPWVRNRDVWRTNYSQAKRDL